MAERINIINRLIAKGGIIAATAKMYLYDEKIIDLLILECAEQCHTKIAKDIWGEELVKDIIDYKANLKI